MFEKTAWPYHFKFLCESTLKLNGFITNCHFVLCMSLFIGWWSTLYWLTVNWLAVYWLAINWLMVYWLAIYWLTGFCLAIYWVEVYWLTVGLMELRQNTHKR